MNEWERNCKTFVTKKSKLIAKIAISGSTTTLYIC